MGKGNRVELVFAGDDKQLAKTFDGIGKDATAMAKDVGKASDRIQKDVGESFDSARESFDDGEQRIVGFRDAITGTGDVVQGFKNGDVVALSTGFADLASSVANFVLPAMKRFASFLTGGLGNALSFVASHPIILAVGALALAFVVLWKNSETFRDIVIGAFEKVKAVVEPVLKAIGGLLGGLGGLFGKGGDDADEFRKRQEEAAEKSKQAWEKWSTDVATQLDSIVNPLSRAREQSKVSLDDINKNLDDNVKFYAGWINNLNLLTQRGFGDLAATLYSFGPTAEKAVGEAIKKTDPQLQKMQDSFTTKMDFAGKKGAELLVNGIGNKDYTQLGQTVGDKVKSGLLNSLSPGTLDKALAPILGVPISGGGGLLGSPGAALNPGGPSAAAGSPLRTNPVTINVNVAGSVISERDIPSYLNGLARDGQLVGIAP